VGSNPIGHHARGARFGLSSDQAGDNPSNIGINDGFGDSKSETSDRAGRVVTDAWKFEKVFQVAGHNPAVLCSNHGGSLVEAAGSPGIAQPVPHAYCLGRAIRG